MAERELSGPPCAPALAARAAAALIPGAARIPFVAGGGGEVPDIVLTRAGVGIDRDHLAAYSRVCGFDLSDALPPTYPSVLAFGLQLALLTDGRFPVPAVGLVHIANRITAHRALSAREQLDLRVWATALTPHRHGRAFDVRAEARCDGELVWEQAATNLAPGQGIQDAPARERPPSSEELPVTAVWRLPGDLGRRYAAVAGDWNPIHLHPLTARPFGFPAPIAHGMWTKARCLAALGPRLPGAMTVAVAFRKPIRLPATVGFAQGRGSSDGGLAFGVHRAGREPGDPPTRHLDGLISPPARPA
ncbi:MAG: MaoC family dehydratase [Solirubrobacteraceae bacterium]